MTRSPPSSRVQNCCGVLRSCRPCRLLLSPSRYFRLNPRSLYAYSMADLSSVACDLYVRGLMTGNEVRDWLGMTPKKDLDQLVMLENYIPAGMIGDQKKLIQDQQKEDKDV